MPDNVADLVVGAKMNHGPVLAIPNLRRNFDEIAPNGIMDSIRACVEKRGMTIPARQAVYQVGAFILDCGNEQLRTMEGAEIPLRASRSRCFECLWKTPGIS